MPASRLRAFKRTWRPRPFARWARTRSRPGSLPGASPWRLARTTASRRRGWRGARLTYIPAGADYCALAPALIPASDSGVTNYAPFMSGYAKLGIPRRCIAAGVCPGDSRRSPARVRGMARGADHARRGAHRALEGRPARRGQVPLQLRHLPRRVLRGGEASPAQSSTIDLHNGWTVQTLTAAAHRERSRRYPRAYPTGRGDAAERAVRRAGDSLATGRRRAMAVVREKTRELSHQALHDSLTGLPNRALVLDRAEQMLARANRRPGHMRRSAVHRRRRLQARQRQPRPCGRRPAAEGRTGERLQAPCVTRTRSGVSAATSSSCWSVLRSRGGNARTCSPTG